MQEASKAVLVGGAVVVEHLACSLQQPQPAEVALARADSVQIAQGPKPASGISSGLGYEV